MDLQSPPQTFDSLEEANTWSALAWQYMQERETQKTANLRAFPDLNTAIDRIGSENITLYLDSNVTLIANATLPATINFIPVLGFQVTLSTYNLTIKKLAPTGTFQWINKNSTGLVAYAKNSAEAIKPEWYGATGDGSTDDYTAIQNAIDACKAYTNLYSGDSHKSKAEASVPLVLQGGAIYKCNTQLWAGGDVDNCLKRIKGNGAVILGADADNPIIDMTAGQVFNWEHVIFEGDSSNIPSVGILLARDSTNHSAGDAVFRDVQIRGSFVTAGVYNYASEANAWFNCEFIIEAGRTCFLWTAANSQSIISDNATIATGAQSCLNNKFYYCTFWQHDDNATETNKSCLECESVHGLLLSGCRFDLDDTYYNKPMVWLQDSGVLITKNITIIGNVFHGRYDTAIWIDISGGTSNYDILSNVWGDDGNCHDDGTNSAYQVKLSGGCVLKNAKIDAPNIDASGSNCNMDDGCIIWLTDTSVNSRILSINNRFEGNVYATSDATLTFTDPTETHAVIDEVDTLYKNNHKLVAGKLKKGGPGSGNQTLTAAMLIGGLVDEDPEGSATWTTDTAENIVAEIPACMSNSSFKTVLYNDATNASGEVVTLAAGTGVTLHGETFTMTEGTNTVMELTFRVRNATPSSEGVDCYVLTYA